MKRFCFIVTGLLMVAPFLSNGQRIVRKNVDQSVLYLNIANKLFEDGKYYAAANYYGKVYVENDTAFAAYRLAESNRQGRFYEFSEIWYEEVAKNKNFPLARYWLGMMQKTNGKYDEAKKSFKGFLENYSKENYYKNRAEKEVAYCDSAKKMINHPRPYNVKHFKENINTSRSDFSAIEPTKDAFYYSSTVDKEKYKLKLFGKKFGKPDTITVTRLFKVPRKDSFYYWSKRIPLQIKLKKKKVNIGSPTFSSNKSTLYFSLCKGKADEKQCAIYRAEKKNGSWGKPTKLSAPVNQKNSSSKNPMVVNTENGNTFLMFTSNRSGGLGRFDLWYSAINENGELSPPKNMGHVVNSVDNEITPFYSKKDKSLYFSSDGYISLGGYDIFRSEGSFQDGWEAPKNMGSPINTGTDDYYFAKYSREGVEEGMPYGFLSSNRKAGYRLNKKTSSLSYPKNKTSQKLSTCCDDVYFFKKTPEDRFRLVVTGDMIDTSGNLLEGVKLTIKNPINSIIYEDTVDNNYIFDVDFKENDRYKISFEKEGYKDTSFVFKKKEFIALRDSLKKEGDRAPFKINKTVVLKKLSEEMILRRKKMVATYLDSVLQAVNEKGDSTLGERAYELMLEKYGNDTLKDLHFKVQVGAYEHPGPMLITEILFSLNVGQVSELETELTDFGVTRFLVGKDYKKLRSADRIRRRIIQEGVEQQGIVIKDSFVAPYYKNKRLTMLEVLRMLSENKSQ